MASALRITLAVAFALLTLTADGRADEKPTLPESIKRSLGGNAAGLKAFDVSLVETRVRHLSVDDMREKFDLDEMYSSGLEHGQELRVIWQPGKIYSRRHATLGWPPTETIYESSVDGVATYAYERQVHPQPGNLYNGAFIKEFLAARATEEPWARFFDWTYFEMSGLEVPTLEGLRTSVPLRSTILKLLDGGAELLAVDERAKLGNRTVTRIDLAVENPFRIDPNKVDLKKMQEKVERLAADEESARCVNQATLDSHGLSSRLVKRFYLDPEKRYAVLSCETFFEGGAMISRSTCENFQKLDGELWLPRKCSDEIFFLSNAPTVPATSTPIATRTWELKEFSAKPAAPEQFVLAPTDQDIAIRDDTKPKEKPER